MGSASAIVNIGMVRAWNGKQSEMVDMKWPLHEAMRTDVAGIHQENVKRVERVDLSW
jgi:hypothetical protein